MNGNCLFGDLLSFGRAPFALLATLSIFLLSQLSSATAFVPAQTEDVDSKPATLIVTVEDQDEKPIVNAHVEVRLWTGDWIETEFKGESDDQGQVKFVGVKPDAYATILLKHPEYASTMQDFTISAGEQRETKCKLFPPVVGSIEIRSPDGELLEGAEISRLEVSSPGSDSKKFFSCDMFPMITGRPKSEFRSDKSGRLKLPPLPIGSNVELTIVHPKWSSAETESVELTGGMMTTVMLSVGTNVTVNFYGEEDAMKALQGQEIAVQTFINDGSSTSIGARLTHKFASSQNKLEFCLPPGQYDAFYLDAAKGNVVITPQLPSSPTISSFNNFAADNVEKHCVVRKKREIRGRVMTSSGDPVVGATLIVSTENLLANSEGEFVVLKEFGWNACDYPVTDEQGYYTAKVPDGKVHVDSQWSKYYSDPAQFEFESDGVQAIPDFVVYPFPTLKGRVLSDAGKACPAAVVRVMAAGGDSQYVLTDDDGKFSTQIKRFEFDLKAKKRKFESKLVVFDPQTNQAEFVTVGVKDPKEFENIVINLQPREPSWLTDLHTKVAKENLAAYPKEVFASLDKIRAESREKFQDGIVGRRAPDLSSGTWFNTDARSLDEFKGQFVLLDFWFIGCGPCERDFPNLKLAQELFGEQGFTVLSVHIATQSPDNVKQFADAKGLDYPLVVDGPNEEILNAYKKAGVSNYPSYLLIGPDGKIVLNDQVPSLESAVGLGLRANKLEAIYEAIRSYTKEEQKD